MVAASPSGFASRLLPGHPASHPKNAGYGPRGEGALQGVPDTLIAESKFLAIAATPQPAAKSARTRTCKFELRQNDFCAGSVFWPDWGWDFPYKARGGDQPGRARTWSRGGAHGSLSCWSAQARRWSFFAPGLGCAGLDLHGAGKIHRLVCRPLPVLGRGLAAGVGGVAAGAAVHGRGDVLYGWSVIDLVGLSFFVAAPFHSRLGLSAGRLLQSHAA
jgi:hypothetical protein